MCYISQTTTESNLQFLVRVTGTTQVELTKCGNCDVPLVRPTITDGIAEHIGLYHYYQWHLCEQCRAREEAKLSRAHARHIAAHSFLGDKDCSSGNCGKAWALVERMDVNGGAMMDHRGGEKLYHLAPLFSIDVSANC